MNMFDLFKKLLMAGQIRFEEGSIAFLNERVVITTAELFVNLMNKFKNDEKTCLNLYLASKHSHVKGFSEAVSKKYKLKQMELAKWLVNTGNVSGWGNMKFTAEDDSTKMFVIEVRNGISQNMKSDVPVDHFLRGQIAGGASSAFDIDFDCIERKCIAARDECCEFVIKPREDFIKNGVSKKYAKQIFSNVEIKKLKIPILK